MYSARAKKSIVFSSAEYRDGRKPLMMLIPLPLWTSLAHRASWLERVGSGKRSLFTSSPFNSSSALSISFSVLVDPFLFYFFEDNSTPTVQTEMWRVQSP